MKTGKRQEAGEGKCFKYVQSSTNPSTGARGERSENRPLNCSLKGRRRRCPRGGDRKEKRGGDVFTAQECKEAKKRKENRGGGVMAQRSVGSEQRPGQLNVGEPIGSKRRGLKGLKARYET